MSIVYYKISFLCQMHQIIHNHIVDRNSLLENHKVSKCMMLQAFFESISEIVKILIKYRISQNMFICCGKYAIMQKNEEK